MTKMDDAIRAAVRELADEGRPVYLGDKALAGVRRKTRRNGTVAVVAAAVVVAATVAWPQWTVRGGHSPAIQPSTPPTAASPTAGPPWPTFSGVPAMPVPPAHTAGNRLVVAAYVTVPTDGSASKASILDPATGQYRTTDMDSVLAFSPDLRYAAVTGHDLVGATEWGIYDTVAGRVLGRLDVRRLAPPDANLFAAGASWSPDGRSIAIEVRRAIDGLGWLAEKVILVDVRTGALSAIDIRPSHGLEPQELLGWTTDSQGIVFAADQTGTDQLARGHIVYSRTGHPAAVRTWPGQLNAVQAIGTDHLILTPIASGEAVIIGITSGEIHHRYPAESIGWMPDWQYPLSWRDGTLIYRSADEIVGVAAGSGAPRRLATLDAGADFVVVAGGDALTGAAAQLTW